MAKIKKLTDKQKLFCERYVETEDAVRSARLAGYSEMYAKRAEEKILDSIEIKNYISKLKKELKHKHLSEVASENEIKIFLTKILRDEEVSVKERFKAAQELMKLGSQDESMGDEENVYENLTEEELIDIIKVLEREDDREEK